MKESFKILTILLVLTGLSLVGCGKKAATNETVLAEFDWSGKHYIVTFDEMEKEISELPKYQQNKYADKEGKEDYLTLMAESRMLLHLAEDKKLSKDEEILKKVDEYRHQLMVEKISEMEVDDKIQKWIKEKPGEYEAELKKYYEENKNDYLDLEQVRLTLITLEDEEQANEVFDEIEGGKDIAEVAKELGRDNQTSGRNTDGDIGFFSRRAFSGFDDFLEAAFSMENGQMTDEIIVQEVEGPRGTTVYHMMFKKLDHKQERQKQFEEEDVRKSVERAVKRNKEEERMKEWIESLREKAKLKTHPDKLTVPAAEEEKKEVEVEQKPEEVK